MGVHKNDRKMI